MDSFISIIIPTYNRAHLIQDTLDSILTQTHVHWECLIVDDGSTDDTESIVKQYSEKDGRFRFLKRPLDKQKGANACRNIGLEHSRGKFINFFDSDDTMHADKLFIQIRALQKHTEAPFCICQTEWIDKQTNKHLGLRAKEIGSSQPLEDYILFKIFWTTIAPLWRKEFLKKNALLFDEDLQQSQEYDFHIKALSINSNYVHINEVLATLYRHDNNISHNLYENKMKLKSNIMVKERILESYRYQLTPKGRVQFYEMLTLMYKQLLQHRYFKLAYRMLIIQFKFIDCLKLPFIKKMIFLMRLIVIFISYGILNRGYHIVKPLK